MILGVADVLRRISFQLAHASGAAGVVADFFVVHVAGGRRIIFDFFTRNRAVKSLFLWHGAVFGRLFIEHILVSLAGKVEPHAFVVAGFSDDRRGFQPHASDRVEHKVARDFFSFCLGFQELSRGLRKVRIASATAEVVARAVVIVVSRRRKVGDFGAHHRADHVIRRHARRSHGNGNQGGESQHRSFYCNAFSGEGVRCPNSGPGFPP